ncbi:unnamed protein product [Calypogeia fissa]
MTAMAASVARVHLGAGAGFRCPAVATAPAPRRLSLGAGARPAVFCSVAVEAKTPPITFHVGETSFTMPFSPGAAKGLKEAINGLFQTFKERESAARAQRWKNMEFRETGEDGVFFEVFCNPNAYSNAFQAKVLITINDEKIKIASEGQLSALKADIDEYIAQHV